MPPQFDQYIKREGLLGGTFISIDNYNNNNKSAYFKMVD